MPGRIHRGTGGILLESFYKCYLSKALRYRRAVAFFSSSIFQIAENEFTNFFSRGGHIELICSPVFNLNDIQSIFDGLYTDFYLQNQDVTYVSKIPFKNKGTWLLAWAIANKRLDIRIALLGDGSTGIYHEKIGIFDLQNSEFITFEGSANESAMAYISNFERIFIHQDFPGQKKYSELILQSFEQLWKNQSLGLNVISLHEAYQKKVIQIRGSQMNDTVWKSEKNISLPIPPSEIIRLPSRVGLREYQKEAINSWFQQNGIGIFSMATGTGKTITALATVEALFKKIGPPLIIIIVAPYLNLLNQWIHIAHSFGLDPVNCSGSRSNWTSCLDACLFLANSGVRPLLSLVTTNSTFCESAFQDFLDKIKIRSILVIDEVHNFGSPVLYKSLPKKISLRLGLSATPKRWMDEEGTKAINNYFGNVVFDLSLEKALQLQPPVLTQYVYNPILISLDDDEREEYLKITKQIARLQVDPCSDDLSDLALGLLLRRARLIACAKNKLPVFKQVILPYKHTNFNLVYCGDGKIEFASLSKANLIDSSEIQVLRQVEAVAKLLGNELKMNVATYTSDTSEEARKSILSEFSCGQKNALVAIRCLDEGIDIPQVRRAFILASSTNPKQFIQRRGRVLRISDGKDIAEIFDFVVIPPVDGIVQNNQEFKVMRRLVEKEMQRVMEFARLAKNGPIARARLIPILSSLKLMHL